MLQTLHLDMVAWHPTQVLKKYDLRGATQQTRRASRDRLAQTGGSWVTA